MLFVNISGWRHERGLEGTTLQARGFDQALTMTTFEIDLDRIEAELRPILDRLEARGTISAGVRLVSLAEAPLDQVARLYTENIGGTIDGVGLSLRHALARGSMSGSFVLMIDDQVPQVRRALLRRGGPGRVPVRARHVNLRSVRM